MSEVHWGLLVAAYLFLAGAGAGALFISGALVLSEKVVHVHHWSTAKYSAISGLLLLMLGTGMIVFDLTSFQYGIFNGDMSKLLRFYRLFMTFESSSMMSIGTWLLTLAIIFALLFCISFKRRNQETFSSRRYALINLIFAVCVASYTALLIGDIKHNIVWSNSILVVIFLVSAISSGAAVVLVINTWLKHSDPHHSFAKADSLVMLIELFVLGIFVYAIANVSKFYGLDNLLGMATSAGKIWWLGAVVVGLLLPLLLNLTSIMGRGGVSHIKEYGIAALTLVGAFCLRYSVLLAGQSY
ncbi:NrfD/PsrC family molybdoenzyme membrane anchor subunit [Shewanella sp. cp20]|uniref:NrfD/PsrC family molybdoenzyme membrane anchor subunit n=1 Tax=Shewanella sp. cp20 TaxID=1521167 RepID=UPI00059F5AF2|nr:NrfD/PsrC family molybdoenzyme membrane anchor subunit [Shewanella sp. cp20]KIO36706.1 polysulfide reductase [Shewanella sp. cp20]